MCQASVQGDASTSPLRSGERRHSEIRKKSGCVLLLCIIQSVVKQMEDSDLILGPLLSS